MTRRKNNPRLCIYSPGSPLSHPSQLNYITEGAADLDDSVKYAAIIISTFCLHPHTNHDKQQKRTILAVTIALLHIHELARNNLPIQQSFDRFWVYGSNKAPPKHLPSMEDIRLLL